MIEIQAIINGPEHPGPPKRIPLDNAAKLFPGISSRKDTWVFRLTCELTEAVDPWALQRAAESVPAHYPLYRCVLHKGLFWYSLEEGLQRPVVRKERTSPCRILYDRRHKGLQFSVTYRDKHIHLEVYHALSDGRGALYVFKLLIADYLARRHPECGRALASLLEELPLLSRSEDSFHTYYNGASVREAFRDLKAAQHGRSRNKRGYRLIGARNPDYKINQLTGIADTDTVVAKAREYGVTVTALLTAALMLAVRSAKAQGKKRRPVVVAIPVDLRKYFLSNSTRNFFQTIYVRHHFDEGTDSLPELSRQIGKQLAEELNPEGLLARMNVFCALEHSLPLRLIPRKVKDTAFRLASAFGQLQTTSLSNLGRIEMPPELKPYLRLFGFTTSTPRMQLNVCSYEKQMVMGFASQLIKTDIQEAFFKLLSEIGLDIRIASGQAADFRK